MKKGILLAGSFIVILVLFLSCSTVLQTVGIGAGIIRGTVIDENNKPVIGAVITTDPPSESTITTFEGFVIKNVKVGYYIVKASKEGYSSASVEVKVQKNKVS